MKHTAFLGDGEHTFALPHPLIEELERKTSAGIGVLFQRIRSLSFSIADISETIRLALIGGGMEPAEAFKLVETYVRQRPLAESLPVALGILETVWFGTPADSQDETGQPENE
ncbi:MAG: gene transfer agent family protein [Mesorhizobium sp.]|nr:gene transfer agent family protein [Mesorhizobium sp.]